MRKTTALLLVIGLAVAGCGDDETSNPESSVNETSTTMTSTTVTSTTRPQRSVLDAVTSWVAEQRAAVFPGFEGEFVGACEEGVVDVLCAIPREDLGVRSIVGVGVASSDWGADVLLERGDEGWTAVDAWMWDLESDELGPPFSPLTAIAEWWSTIDPDAVFVRSCEEIADPPMGQELVCAVVVTEGDEVRRYRTGPPPSVDAHQVEVRYQPDHRWIVAG